MAVDATQRRKNTRRRFLKYGITAAVAAGAVGASFPYLQGWWKGGIVGDNETSSLVTSNSTLVTGKPSIVFAHGLWADGSCFSKVIPTLQADGYEVLSTQN
ncbi:MAG TPA: twin-arginine translocation signal domain-containing protein, partial [Candidatus Bathyarchaeia archaeon]|nr:twin-arginine translocation signal domain-containing protein [Candidatus Bathyarchaeia archaeon]